MSKKLKNKPKAHSPQLDYTCFGCYKSYWVLWDASPNKHVIHMILDALEEKTEQSEKKKSKKKRGLKKKDDVLMKEFDEKAAIAENGDEGREGNFVDYVVEGFVDDDEADGNSSWRHIINVNFTALVDSTRLLQEPHNLSTIQTMRKLKKPGAVMNMGSAAGLYPVPADPFYSASKGGVVLFTRSCALLAREGIRVNALCPKGIDGSRVEKVLEAVHIAANKNTVPGDVSAMVPGGIRMGTPTLTSRGFVKEDFEKVAEFFAIAVNLALKVKSETKGGTKLKDFVATLKTDSSIQSEIEKLHRDVGEFAKPFLTIGFEKETMKYKN